MTHAAIAFGIIALLTVSASHETCLSSESCPSLEHSADFNVLIQNKVQTVASSDKEEVTGHSLEEVEDESNSFKPGGSRGGGSKKSSSQRKGTKKGRNSAHTNTTTELSNNSAHTSTTRTMMKAGLALCVALFCGSFCCLAWAGSKKQFQWDLSSDDPELEPRTSSPLDEDTYGLAVSLLLRDTAVLEAGEGHPMLRGLRFALVFLLVFLNKGLQVFLVFQVLELVTPKIVRSSRRNYDAFEYHMYGSDPTHFHVLPDGDRRGLPEFFQPKLFATLDPLVKADTCAVPFSQPAFFIVVLFVWTLTCIGDIRKSFDMFDALIFSTPTVIKTEHMVTSRGESGQTKLIIGLTRQMKVFITTIILLPRTILTVILLWLGSRWLASTNNFGDLIMNTVALEFILLLQNLLYMTLVPARNKRDCQSIETMPPQTHEKAGLYVFASSFLWGVIALAWAFVYTYQIQQVLPHYNWDVRDVCAEWLGRGR